MGGGICYSALFGESTNIYIKVYKGSVHITFNGGGGYFLHYLIEKT